MKNIRSKKKALEWPQVNMLIFFGAEGQITPIFSGGILQKFKLIQGFMDVLVNCKNEEDPMKNEFVGVATTFLPLKVYGNFSIRSRAANSAAFGPICPQFELCPGFIVVLVT